MTAAAASGGMVVELLDLDRLMTASTEYWLRPRLPDENVMFADVHWEVIKRIIPAYDRFVNLSTNINRSLSADFDVSTTSHRTTVQYIHYTGWAKKRSHNILQSTHNFVKYWPIFTVRRSLHGICYSNSVRPSVRPSVCLSVCHTRGLCPHRSTYDHDFFTTG